MTERGGGIARLVRSAGIYTSANIVNALVPFLIFPIVTNVVGAHDYGLFGVYVAIVNVVVPFSGLIISRSVSRAFVDPGITIRNYIASAMALSTVATTALLLLTFFGKEPFGALLEFPPAWILVAVLASFFQTQLSLTLATMQMRHRPTTFGAVRVSQSLMNAGMTLAFIILLDMQWRGLVLGHALALALYYPLSWVILKREDLIGSIVKDYAVDAFKYGAPLIPHVIAGVFIAMSDRVLLAKMVSLEAAGVYSASYQVGMAMFLVITSVNQAFMPWLFEQLADEDNCDKVAIVKATYLYFGGLVALVAIGWVAAPTFISVYLGEEFQQAGVLLPGLMAAFALQGFYIMMGNYLYFSKRTGLLSVSAVLAALMNVGLNLVLIPRYDVFGAVGASVASIGLAFVITWVMASREIRMPWFSFWR